MTIEAPKSRTNNQYATSMIIDSALLDEIQVEARQSPRLRMNKDMRTASTDTSQRMLNALEVGTIVPIHRHRHSTETTMLLRGHVVYIYYDKDGNEMQRFDLNPLEGRYGIAIPKGQYHGIEVIEPSVIFDAKDGAYLPATPEDFLKK